MYAVALAICVLMLNAPVVLAQDTAQSAPAKPTSSQPEPVSKPDADRGLPVSLDRIRMRLAETSVTKTEGGLRLERTIEVVGVAPPIELWDPQKVKQVLSGPSPFGPPTQKDFLDLTTPQEFKRYPFDLNALMQWLAQKLGDEKKAE